MDLIIGAGVTGLSFAMFTPQKNYLVLEKSREMGGYCKTTQRNGFIWDYSGHFFHFQDPEIRDLVLQEMDRDTLYTVVKNSQIKYKDLWINYPFQKNIHQLSKEEFIDCLYDLYVANDTHYGTFQEMLYCKFGAAISEKFLIPYNEKLYACSLDTLDKDAMGRFFPYADKEDIVLNFRAKESTSYNATFIYPEGGAIEYIRAIARHIDNEKIKYNSEVVSIDTEQHKVYLSDGTVYSYDRLVSTLPFPKLLDLSGIEYDSSIYTCNQVLCFNLGFDRKGKDTSNHWLYFPEKKYCFYRVGFYDNILNKKRMSLYVELGFPSYKAIQPNEWLGPVLRDLKKAGIMSEEQTLIDYQSIIMNPAYVHINQKSIEDVVLKKQQLAQLDIYSIGRYGSWTYCSIEDNIKEAQVLAQTL